MFSYQDFNDRHLSLIKVNHLKQVNEPTPAVSILNDILRSITDKQI